MGEVVDLDRRPYEAAPDAGTPNRDVVEWAERLLEKAKSGQIDCFVVVAGCPDGSVIYTSAGDCEKPQIIGGLSIYQHAVNRQIVKRW